MAKILGLFEEENRETQKVILYARVSTNGQSKGISKGSETNSLARQIKELRSYARNELNCKDPVIFKDTGSAINSDRPLFKRLIQEILQGVTFHGLGNNEGGAFFEKWAVTASVK